MRVMVLSKATRDTEAGIAPDPAFRKQMLEFNDQLVRAGVLLAAESLHPTTRGKRVWCDGENRTVTDGPFADTRDLVAGFWLWQVKSLDEAVEWVMRCPVPASGRWVEIEIRPVLEGPPPPDG